MPMTMQETRDVILAMLDGLNGLEPRPYNPYAFAQDKYVAPGNYAYAESVERGDEGDKFDWIAHSFYEAEKYVNIHDLRAQLELVFAGSELCKAPAVNIFHNGDEMAHSVEYRFHTFGVDRPENPDAPDFCPSCGWTTEGLKCNAIPDNHPSEACHYLCTNCDKNTGVTTPCLRKMTIRSEVKLEAHLTHSPRIVSAVSVDVLRPVGEILMGYALAENDLRAMMVNVPGHNPRSNLSEDIERLKNHKGQIVASASAISHDGGQAVEECIDSIINSFGKIHLKRNALAHGRLWQIGLSISTFGVDKTERSNEGSRLQIEHNGDTIELTEAGIQEPLDSVRELQVQVGWLGRILENLGPRGRF